MKLPLISIIIPTCNAAETLDVCLSTIISQTYKNYEIMIMDGISKDNTMMIANDYARHSSLKTLSEKDNGIYDAMNKGIRLAKGDWLYFMGSDDVLANAYVLEKLSAEIQHGDDIIYGNVTWLPSGKREEGEWSYSRFLKGNINHQRIFYRAGLFKSYGNFNTLYPVASDHELNIRFLCNDEIRKRYVNIDIALYHEKGFSADKIDIPFWNNWNNTVFRPFSSHLPSRDIYGSLGWYCWYNIRQKKYVKAFKLFGRVLIHTRDFAFIKHTLSQVSKVIRQ